MPRSCAYCGYMIGNTKDHIFPKSVIRDMGISNDSRNMIYACPYCNREKGAHIYLPTPINLRDKFIHFMPTEVCRFADYLYSYKRKIIKYYNSAVKFYIHMSMHPNIPEHADDYKDMAVDKRIEYLEFLIFCKYYEFGFYNEENISKYVKGRI